MTRKTRRIIFILFLIAFLILAPVIILYARGYSFDWDKKTIVATGGIYLKSLPSKAEIYINDKPKGKTNKLVGRLIPRIYEIKIIKQDYHPWQKELGVEARLVTKASDILLVPFNPKISLKATEKEEYLSFFEEPYSLADLTELVKKKSKYTIFNIDNLNIDKNGEKIYFLSNNNLYSLQLNKENINDSLLSDVLVSNVVNYTIYKNGIIYLDYFTGKIFELDVASLKSAEFFDQVFPSFNQGEWILSNNAKKLLCKKSQSVEILWLEGVTNNSVIREKGDVEKIDFATTINDVIWHPKTDEHLIVSTNDSILVTELDNRPSRNTINFITTEKPQIQYNAKNKTLYFLSQERLYETEL